VDAAESWLKNLASVPDLKQFANSHLVQTSQPASLSPQKPIAAILTNDPADLETGAHAAPRLRQFRRITESLGLQPVFIPVAATYGLTDSEKHSFENWMNSNVSLLIAMGGDDISPDLYGEPQAHAVSTNRARDVEEMAIISSYLKNSKGRLIGICRGMQLSAVASGLKLIDDIPERTGSKIHRASAEAIAAGDYMVNHPIETKTTTNSLLRSIVGNEWMANSYHHQSVRAMPNTRFEVAATAPDGIVEALESRDGRALLLQFHPELMMDPNTQELTPAANHFWKGIANWTTSVSPHSSALTCSSLFSTAL
jgi:putative glutamine amidotransferase